MQRSLTISAIALAVALGASAFAASAQTAPAADEAQAQGQRTQRDDRNAPIDRNCLQYTGSRIKAVDRKTGKRLCSTGPGQVYSRDDLNRTGETDIADALRRLDTSVY